MVNIKIAGISSIFSISRRPRCPSREHYYFVSGFADTEGTLCVVVLFYTIFSN